MKIFNSLTRKKEVFIPMDPDKVLMYSCGPTVYQRAHIGNFRTYTMVDVLHRVLIANNYKVKHVTNITDVGHLTGDNLGDSSTGDDRMEIAARRNLKSIWEIAEEFTGIFLRDYHDMNLLSPEIFAKATDNIAEQIKLIEELEKKGFTYKISDGIYFDTGKFPSYGQLSNLDNIDSRARIDGNIEKRNRRDFALWKFNLSKEKRQMEWKSPWGVGFPGWHIECSAMSMKYLGPKIDIHCGGEDLMSTHHPNEIAQTEAVTGETFSRYWFHVAFLLIDGKKMSKSLNNSYSIDDLAKKGFDTMALKYFYYSGYYRKQINLTDTALESAKRSLINLREVVFSGRDGKSEDIMTSRYNEFLEKISDDLNTAEALSVLWSIVRDKSLTSQEKAMTILECDKVLGLRLDIDNSKGSNKDPDLPDEVSRLAEKRIIARNSKDWSESDRLREEINKLGFEVLDTSGGQVIKASVSK